MGVKHDMVLLSGASDQDKQKLASSLQDLSKLSATCSKLLKSGEGALIGNVSAGEAEIIDMNMQKLKLIGQEAEEVAYQKQ